LPPPPPPPDIRLVKTDIAGFVGFAERGPVLQKTDADPAGAQAALKLTSWQDFRLKFGGFISNSFLAYAVRAFFANGGASCYVVRVGAAASPPATAIMPLPAVDTANLVTYIAAQTSPGQGQIKLDSSDVVAAEDLIAIGDPETGECLSVASIADDQTINVQPPPQSVHAAGDPVFLIQGTSLAADVKAGASDIQVSRANVFQNQDLVSVEGGGLSEIRVVLQAVDSTLHLALPLNFPYTAGTVVRRHSPALTVTADSAGAWGNRIRLQVIPLEPGNVVTHFSLRVTVDRGQDPGQPIQQEFYPLLSLDPQDPSPTPIYAPAIVNNASQLIQIADHVAPGSPAPKLLVRTGPLAQGSLYLEGGADGLESGSVATQDFLDALNALGQVDEVAILCCPDAVAPAPPTPAPVMATPAENPCNGQSTTAQPGRAVATPAPNVSWNLNAIQQAMLTQCNTLRYRVAVLDTPPSLQPSMALDWLNKQQYFGPAARFGAVYFPWLKVPDQLNPQGPNISVPPTGHVAGGYAYTDNQFGVGKPPANVQLSFVSDVELAVTNQQQGFLNERGINAIRPFPGRGIRIWGARSISTEPDWKYIHTRRLLSMIEDSVEKASQWIVFQPNTADLRRMLTHSLNVFLQLIWLTGSLKGSRPSEGYFVVCDDTNNPQSSIDAGRLICQVGVAIAVPMEFLVFDLRRDVEGLQVVEA